MASEPPGKKTECVKVWMDERLFMELNRLAILDDRKLSEYIHLVLYRFAFGNATRGLFDSDSPEAGRNGTDRDS